MVKDLFIIDSKCHLNRSITKAFERAGYEVKVNKYFIPTYNFFFVNDFFFLNIQVVEEFYGLPDDVLRQAKGYVAVCIFVNKVMTPEQVK